MSTSASFAEAHPQGERFARWSGTSVLVGGLMGVLDLGMSLLERPTGFSSIEALYPPLLATALVFALLHWSLSRLATLIVRRAPSSGEQVQIALAFFLVTVFLSVSALHLPARPSEPKEWFALGAALSFSALVAAAAGLAWTELSRSARPREAALVAAIASPFLLFELVLLEWAELYHIESVLSPLSLVSLGALGIALVLTFRLIRRRPGRACALLASLALALPLGVLAFRGAARAAHAPQASDGRDVKRVILISADSLRADALSSYNPKSPPSPRLDRLAADGVRFERAYASAPWTLASLASALTGLSPAAHTLTEVKLRLPDEVLTLSEHLSRAGYHTGAIVLNDLLHPRSNLSQGFDDYRFLTEPSFGPSFGARLLQWALPSLFPSPPWPRTEDITASALEWLDDHRDSAFFLWVHYYDPHAPYTPPLRYLPDGKPPAGMTPAFYAQKDVLAGFRIPSRAERQWIETLYRAEVLNLDDGVGSLLDGLRNMGLYEDSLIVFTSDHGEELWDHGALGHGHTLYNELLSVPLLVKPPAPSPAGRRVDTRVPTEAITPTILDLCGIPYETGRFSSSSLAPLLRTEAEPYEASPVVSSSVVLFDRKESVLFGDLKYVRSTIGDSEVLFDLLSDPTESAPLAPSESLRCAQAREILERHREASRRLRDHFGVAGHEEAAVDEDTLRRLRALGYVQ